MKFKETIIAHEVDDENGRTEDVGGGFNDSTSFESLLLSEHVLAGLKSSGFKTPSPVQRNAIPCGRMGFDMVVQAKSGTGKTCVFAVLALESVITTSRHPQVLIVAPTHEIATQITSSINNIGRATKNLRVGCFIGGQSVQVDMKNVQAGCQIVVGSPGRLCQLVKDGSLSLSDVKLFILDEADQLMADSYQTPINYLFSVLGEQKQVCVFSATYPAQLDSLLSQYMRTPTMIKHNAHDVQLLGIKQYAHCSKREDSCGGSLTEEAIQALKLHSLLALLRRVTYTQCLIFTNYQDRAEHLCADLKAAGLDADYISSQLEQRDRNKAIKKLKEFKSRLLVSTDLTARGIDAQKVNLVINVDVPREPETYFHRIGRAGRYGGYGAAISLLVQGVDDRRFYVLGHLGHFLCRMLPDSYPTDLCTNIKYWQGLDVIDFDTLSQSSTYFKTGKSSTAADRRQMVVYDGLDMFGVDNSSNSNGTVLHSNGHTLNADSHGHRVDTDSVTYVTDSCSNGQTVGSEDIDRETVLLYGQAKVLHTDVPSTTVHKVQQPKAVVSEWRPIYKNRPRKLCKRVDPGADGWDVCYAKVSKWQQAVDGKYKAKLHSTDQHNVYNRDMMKTLGITMMKECFGQRSPVNGTKNGIQEQTQTSAVTVTAVDTDTGTTSTSTTGVQPQPVLSVAAPLNTYPPLPLMIDLSRPPPALPQVTSVPVQVQGVSSLNVCAPVFTPRSATIDLHDVPAAQDNSNVPLTSVCESAAESSSSTMNTCPAVRVYDRMQMLLIAKSVPIVTVHKLDAASYGLLRAQLHSNTTLLQRIAHIRDTLCTQHYSTLSANSTVHCRVPAAGVCDSGSNMDVQTGTASHSAVDTEHMDPVHLLLNQMSAVSIEHRPQHNDNAGRRTRSHKQRRSNKANAPRRLLTPKWDRLGHPIKCYSRHSMQSVKGERSVHEWRAEAAKLWPDQCNDMPFVPDYTMRCPVFVQINRMRKRQQEQQSELVQDLMQQEQREREQAQSRLPQRACIEWSATVIEDIQQDYLQYMHTQHAHSWPVPVSQSTSPMHTAATVDDVVMYMPCVQQALATHTTHAWNALCAQTQRTLHDIYAMTNHTAHPDAVHMHTDTSSAAVCKPVPVVSKECGTQTQPPSQALAVHDLPTQMSELSMHDAVLPTTSPVPMSVSAYSTPYTDGSVRVQYPREHMLHMWAQTRSVACSAQLVQRLNENELYVQHMNTSMAQGQDVHEDTDRHAQYELQLTQWQNELSEWQQCFNTDVQSAMQPAAYTHAQQLAKYIQHMMH